MTNDQRTLIEFRNERQLAEILALKHGFTVEQVRAGLTVPATMPISRTILSDDGQRRAIVTQAASVQVDYSRVAYDNAGRPSWRHCRTTEMQMPFHAALDAAHAIIQETRT